MPYLRSEQVNIAQRYTSIENKSGGVPAFVAKKSDYNKEEVSIRSD
jgi:hypothetical protein